MEKQKAKEKDYNAIALGPTRTRFSDCCNQPIEQNRCPNCGNWIEDNEGRRELTIRGIDGRSQPKPGTPIILFKSVGDDKAKAEAKEREKMPKYFKQLEESGKTIIGWTASDS